MTLFDTVNYQGRECVVEQEFYADGEHYLMLRPTARPVEYSGEVSGTYYVPESRLAQGE